jgi:hypothetical protein
MMMMMPVVGVDMHIFLSVWAGGLPSMDGSMADAGLRAAAGCPPIPSFGTYRLGQDG